MLRCSLASVWLLLFLWFDTSASEMPNSEFIDGMAYELDGRATMHAITANMAERYADGPMHTYWSSYHRLEAFSKPKYENIARVFGVALPGKTWISVKSKVISCLPGFMIPGALADLRKRTIAYVDKLRWLSEIGPAEERDFYAYMVRQELMQVQLMELALREEYVAAESLVAEFISRESAAGGNSF